MIKIVLVFIAIFFYCPLKSQNLEILFVGSSYTYFNNMPQILADIATSKSDTVYFETNEQSGTDFEFFSTDLTVLNKINSRDWDYVVLQEKSILPALDTLSVQENVFPYAKILDSIIHENSSCTETVFFMTWGKQNGDSAYCENYPQVCTYAGMQQRLRESYLQLSENNHATTAPVGAVWEMTREIFPAINLYYPDESRPSLNGSYLTACTFYASLFHKSAIGAFYPPEISSEDALNIQTISSQVVLDSLWLWQGKGDIANPNFTHSINGNQVLFTNQSFNASEFLWNFGDNSTSSEINPLHIYDMEGGYNVTLTAFDSCSTFKTKNSIEITSTHLNQNQNANSVFIYPNPSRGKFTLNHKFETPTQIRIYDSSNQEINNFELKNQMDNQIDLSKFSAGKYQLLISQGSKIKAIKIIIVTKE